MGGLDIFGMEGDWDGVNNYGKKNYPKKNPNKPKLNNKDLELVKDLEKESKDVLINMILKICQDDNAVRRDINYMLYKYKK